MDGYSRNLAPSQMPPLFNQTHNLPPINLSGNPTVDVHPQAIPLSRREAGNQPSDTQNSPPSARTNYQTRTERGRVRRSTIDSYDYPQSSPSMLSEQERPIYRSVSPKIYDNNFRAGDGGYISMPDPLRYQDQQQQYHHWERENDQNKFIDTDIKTQPTYLANASRYLESVDHDYEDIGFRYTNPRDMSLYALDQLYDEPRPYTCRYGPERRPRPRSIQTYADLVPPNIYDSRDDGPPVSSRGFDKLRLGIREKNTPSLSPVRATFIEPRTEMRYRPQSVGPRNPGRSPHHSERLRSISRDIFYDARERRRRRNSLEKEEYMERLRMRTERRDRSENDRMNEQKRRGESKDPKEHRGRDALAAGLSIAGAALGLAALRNAALDERNLHEEQEGRKRKEQRREKRHKKKRVSEESSDSQSSLDSREKSKIKNGAAVRGSKISREDAVSSTRGQNERQKMKEKRAEYLERRQRQKNRSKLGQLETSSSENESSDSWRRNSRRGKDMHIRSAYDPNDMVDLTAMKQEIHKIYKKSSKKASHEADTRKLKNPINRSNDETWTEVDSESHSTVASDNRKPRVVSPPREKVDEKPVKGILRTPRDKFPEDPAPAREGVALPEDVKRKGNPSDAVWTRVTRRLVNAEALESRNERFEVQDDYILIFRVLTKEEIQYYADLTQEIRIFHEQEYEKFEDNLASNSDAPESNFEHQMQNYNNSDYHPDDPYNYNRTNYYPEAQSGYRHIDYPEGQHDYGYTGYPEGQNSYGHVNYPAGEQQVYGHINNTSEDQYRTGQIYYNIPQSYGNSEPATYSHTNDLPYDERIQTRDTDCYLREKNGPYMYEEGSRGDNNLQSEYSACRPHENRVPEYHLSGAGTEPYPPEFDSMAWNMMNSAGGWHEFRGP
ncbi:putative zinc finger protein dhhc domain containing protein [Erysiphe neolycopersici]|uniref:Putative zinc finger protein dhhc domain containing protein n=1 Tax=Erysiphe neolycopersici TaxID=212602 RepID=A0A420HL59_9PEZI|nr:putative zinc finger protein dhhc domain containing protein [Erysiphe neolycopersici]